MRVPGYEGDGGLSTTARLNISAGRGGGARVAVDGAGNLFIAEKQTINSPGRIRKVTAEGSISTFATLP